MDVKKSFNNNKVQLLKEINLKIKFNNKNIIKQHSECIKNILNNFCNVQKKYDLKFESINNKFKSMKDKDKKDELNEISMKNEIEVIQTTLKEHSNETMYKNVDCNNIILRLTSIETNIIHQMNLIMSQGQIIAHGQLDNQIYYEQNNEQVQINK